jgi:hypothetical protein
VVEEGAPGWSDGAGRRWVLHTVGRAARDAHIGHVTGADHEGRPEVEGPATSPAEEGGVADEEEEEEEGGLRTPGAAAWASPPCP